MLVGFIMHGHYAQKDWFRKKLNKTFSGINIRLAYTTHAGHATALVADLVNDGCTHVVVCGGDGSLHEAVNGVMKLPEKQRPVLAILPFGTGNDFVKSLMGPRDLESLKTALLSNQTLPVDVALATVNDAAGHCVQRYLINIAEVGIGGTIAEKLSKSSKFFGSFITYQYYILSTLLSYKPQVFSYRYGTESVTRKMMNVVIANGRYFGGGLCISPDSNLQDGMLNVVELGDLSTRDYLVHLPAIRNGKKVMHPEVKYAVSASSITVESPMPMPVDMDGEHVGFTPLQVSVLPAAVSFLV